MDVNKIRIITCIHGRHEVVRCFFWQLEYLRKETKLPLPITVAYSDDEDFEVIKDFLTEKCEAVKTPNNPLSEKHNQMLRTAARRKDWNCLIHLGSDDLMSAEYVIKVSELKLDTAVYGVNELYFYNLPADTLKIYKYEGVKLLGAGRIFPRSVINLLKGKRYKFRRPYYGILTKADQYIPYAMQNLIEQRHLAEKVEGSNDLICLWMGHKNSGLDNESTRVLRACGIPEVNIGEYFEHPQMVDLKTRANITPWERITGNTIPSPYNKERLKEIAPEIEFNEA